jgi:asparagine N-glycosylation enzyme membrane subunit Stt3
MDLSRLTRGEKIAAVAGLVLLAALFMPWFGSENAWRWFSWIDLFLALTVAVALVWTLSSTLQARLPLPVATVLLLLAVVSLVLILFRLASPPGPSSFDKNSRDVGIYVAFLACAALAYGGYMGMRERDEGTPAERDEDTPAP